MIFVAARERAMYSATRRHVRAVSKTKKLLSTKILPKTNMLTNTSMFDTNVYIIESISIYQYIYIKYIYRYTYNIHDKIQIICGTRRALVSRSSQWRVSVVVVATTALATMPLDLVVASDARAGHKQMNYQPRYVGSTRA